MHPRSLHKLRLSPHGPYFLESLLHYQQVVYELRQRPDLIVHDLAFPTPHDVGTIDPPPHRPPPFWLALARQRSRLHRRATPARSPTPNPLAQRTGRAFKIDSAIF